MFSAGWLPSCAIQSRKSGKQNHALVPPNNPNPFVPPTGDTCYINNLPPELLSCIFEVGALEDDDGGADAWIQGCYEGLEEGYKSGADNDVETADDKKVEVPDQDEDEEGDDEEWSDTTGSSDLDSPSPPFHVSHVCRHWRNVALSTSSLWTTIEVPSNSRSPYENVSVLLERSKALPIDIYIDYDWPGDNPVSVEFDQQAEDHRKGFLYSLLVPHVQRWRSIKLETISYNAMYGFLRAVSDPSVPAASQLATLQLYNYAEPDGSEDHRLLNPFTLFRGSAPNLTKLVLRGVHVDWNQGWIASAYNLRYLKLACHQEEGRPTWAQFAPILRGAPQLETLILYDSGPSGEPTEWIFEPTPSPGRPTEDLNAPIQLLNLTHFTFASGCPERSLGLFPKFYLTSLKSLTLDLSGGDLTDPINQLARPAPSLSSPSLSAEEEKPRSLLRNLETLKIQYLFCGSEEVETLYSELHNLQSLHLTPSYLPPEFVDLLCQPCTLPGRGDIWLPRLKSLWIWDAPGDLIRQVVQKRKDAGVPLKALYVDDECDVGHDDVEWFRENVETFDFFDECEWRLRLYL